MSDDWSQYEVKPDKGDEWSQYEVSPEKGSPAKAGLLERFKKYIPQPSPGMEKQFDDFLRRLEEKGTNPSENPSIMALGGMINNLGEGLKNPEAMANAVQDVSTFGQGKRVSAPINALINRKLWGDEGDTLEREKSRQETLTQDNPYLPFAVGLPMSEVQSAIKTKGLIPESMSQPLANMGNSIGDFAKKRAVQVMNFPEKILDKIALKSGRQGILDTGANLLEEGVVATKNAPDKIQGRVNDLLNTAQKEMSTPLAKIDEAGIRNFDPQKVLTDIKGRFSNLLPEEDAMIQHLSAQGKLSDVEKKVLEHFADMKNPDRAVLKKIEDILTSQGTDALSPTQGHQLRQTIDDVINYNKFADPKSKEKILNATRSAISDELERAVAEAGDHLGNSDLVNQFLMGNQKYSLGKTSQLPAAKGVAREFLGSESQSSFGTPQTSSTLFQTAKDVGSNVVGKYVTNPGRLDWLSKVLQQSPEALGKYGPSLQSAAAKGGVALAAENYVLNQKDPEYRETIRSLSGQDPNH